MLASDRIAARLAGWRHAWRHAKWASPLLYGTGVLARRWRQEAARAPLCVVVMYHRIAAPGGRGESAGFGVERGVPVGDFEAQLRFLRRHFTPVSLEALAGDPVALPRLAFAVTFDDGYEDNRTLAAPVLERLGVPATVFLNTDYVGTTRRFWWESLGALLRETREPRLDAREVVPELAARWAIPDPLPLTTDDTRAQAHWQLSMAFMRTPAPEIDALLEKLAAALRAPLRRDGREAPLLDWEGVRALRRHGVSLGAHGASHANLGLAAPEAARREVLDSVARVAAETQAPVHAFAYPYGGREHRSAAAEAAVRESGCRLAFTTESGVVRPASPPLALPRVGFTRPQGFVCAWHTDRAVAGSHRDAA